MHYNLAAINRKKIYHGNEIKRLQVSDWLQNSQTMRSQHIVGYFKCNPYLISLAGCSHLKQALKVIWKSHWICTEFQPHASVAYSTLCSVPYTRECSDSSQPVYADIIMTSVALCWRPHCTRGSVVSIMALWFPLASTSTEGLARKLASTLAELWHTPLKVVCKG